MEIQTHIGRRIGHCFYSESGGIETNAGYYIAHLVHSIMQQEDTGDWHTELLADLWRDAEEFGIESVTTNNGFTYFRGTAEGSWKVGVRTDNV